jgi:hypothetical protein
MGPYAAIDPERRAADMGSAVRRQEGDGVSDFLDRR